MTRKYFLAPLLALTACSQAPDTAPTDQSPAAAATPAPPIAAATPVPTPTPSPTPTPTPTTDPRFSPAVLVPEAERGEKGARNVLLAFGAAMENRDFASARVLFGHPGERTAQEDRAWIGGFDGYRRITVGFGDGGVEGGAGSLYYEVPVWLTATGPDGAVRRDGTISLRRVNDVQGASAASLRWHIDRLDW